MPAAMRARAMCMKQLEREWSVQHELFNEQLRAHYGVETVFASTAAERKRKHPLEQSMVERQHFVDRARDPRLAVDVVKARRVDEFTPQHQLLCTPTTPDAPLARAASASPVEEFETMQTRRLLFDNAEEGEVSLPLSPAFDTVYDALGDDVVSPASPTCTATDDLLGDEPAN